MNVICKELEALGLKQEALSELASNACITPQAQIARIRSIVAELTTPIVADVNSRFEALRHSPGRASSSSGTPSLGRRADPEPEPEMIDLRRLEERQEESRQALEELQQQLCEIKRPDDGDRPDGGQLLELDERLKADLKAHLPAETPSVE